MSEQSGRKSSDLIDAHAQLEVLKLQIQILKDALKEKEKEVEKEKKLGSEWKQKAFKQVRQQNANTGEKILQSPEYKVYKGYGGGGGGWKGGGWRAGGVEAGGVEGGGGKGVEKGWKRGGGELKGS